MGWITLSSRKVKIRKPHQCHGCSKVSPVDSEMQKTACVDGGDFSSTYMCMICHEFMEPRWGDYNNELGSGEVWEDPEYKEFRARKLGETTQ